MSAVFTAMDVSEREAFERIYLHYLRGRDGAPSLDTKTFSRRERRFAELEATMTTRPLPGLDPEVFDRNLTRHKPEPGLSQRMLWALAMAKISRSERYGVEYKLKTNGFADATKHDPNLYVELEEFYHSRLIALALRNVGLTATMQPPSRMTQMALRVMMQLPNSCALIIIMAAEVAGVTVFRMLAEKAQELFADEPEALARILELLSQLIVDEVGHVYFVRSRLDQARLRMAELLLPMVARALLDDTPEVWPLFGREPLLKAILAADIPAAVAAFPDRSAPLSAYISATDLPALPRIVFEQAC